MTNITIKIVLLVNSSVRGNEIRANPLKGGKETTNCNDEDEKKCINTMANGVRVCLISIWSNRTNVL